MFLYVVTSYKPYILIQIRNINIKHCNIFSIYTDLTVIIGSFTFIFPLLDYNDDKYSFSMTFQALHLFFFWRTSSKLASLAPWNVSTGTPLLVPLVTHHAVQKRVLCKILLKHSRLMSGHGQGCWSLNYSIIFLDSL